ncbi:hypothetical protein AMK16_10190 [Streptomyces sp. CB00455]|uniref:hypothetical protein n=1 Tax=Streptomyces sp. CB00455 TaxID=1703927 RepID=UPI00093DB5B0|nr:hypothetical protein [Streptomyces sp. CB00455]OKK20783.1 hypothetical protein AMK16_10190 [Streptomyces sp. CB00455]
MLTYQEVMTTDYGRLLTAADRWQSMAEQIHKVEGRYRDSVQKIHTTGNWIGLSSTASSTNFAATRYEYQAAQTQAKATATLLRNGHQQLTELKKKLEDARADAVKAGMSVSGQGVVAFDYDKLSAAEKNAMRHDPDYLRSVKTAEESWREYIKECVKAVDEADQDLRKDLEAVVKDGSGGKGDGTLGTGFNGQAGAVAKADDAQKQERLDLAWLKKRDNETLDDYMERLQKEGVTRLTGNPKLAELVSNVSKGTATAGAFAAALTAAGMNSWKLSKYFKDVKAGNFPKAFTAPGTLMSREANARLAGAAPGSLMSKLPPNVAAVFTGSDEAAMWGGKMQNGRFFMPTAAEANLVTVARQGGAMNAMKAAGALRGLGVVGGVAATAYGMANLATYDTDMIKKDPAKFATDLTGTAFSASMTALTVAPTPVTAALAVGTGVAYGAALIWDNHEAIGKGLEKAGDSLASGAKKLGSALNPFD